MSQTQAQTVISPACQSQVQNGERRGTAPFQGNGCGALAGRCNDSAPHCPNLAAQNQVVMANNASLQAGQNRAYPNTPK